MSNAMNYIYFQMNVFQKCQSDYDFMTTIHILATQPLLPDIHVIPGLETFEIKEFKEAVTIQDIVA